MTRHCNGKDPNLVRFVDEPIRVHHVLAARKVDDGRPCDCGLVFDDVLRSTIYPHSRI